MDTPPNDDRRNRCDYRADFKYESIETRFFITAHERNRAPRLHSRNRRGLGRLEVILVLLCLGMMAALAATGIYQRRLSADANLCGARQYRVALALQGFSNDFQEVPGFRNLQAITADDNSAYCSWVFPSLPFLEPLNQPLTIRSGDSTRQVRGDQPPMLQAGEQIVLGQSSFQELVDRYGPSGGNATRGKKPELRIAELICPAAATAEQATNSMNWRINVGLPDRGSEMWPPDWPANGVFLDAIDGTSMQSFQSIESHDGLGYTVMLSEGLRPLQWTDTQEVELGMYWAFDRSQASPTEPVPSEASDENDISEASPSTTESTDPAAWSLLGVEPKLGGSGPGLSHTRPTSFHPNGVTVTFCSGATQTITRDIDPVTWAQMMMSNVRSARFPGTEVAIPARLGGLGEQTPEPKESDPTEAKQEEPKENTDSN
jgi:type II secretory pathway pseudopilin PulG